MSLASPLFCLVSLDFFIYVSSLFSCLLYMSLMHVSYVCLLCMSLMYVSYICLVCMSLIYIIYVFYKCLLYMSLVSSLVSCICLLYMSLVYVSYIYVSYICLLCMSLIYVSYICLSYILYMSLINVSSLSSLLSCLLYWCLFYLSLVWVYKRLSPRLLLWKETWRMKSCIEKLSCCDSFCKRAL